VRQVYNHTLEDFMQVTKGSPVRYKVGRGWGRGKVAKINRGMATLTTNHGQKLNRRVSELVPANEFAPSLASELMGKPTR
jgi:hypothetical protein